MPHVSRNTYPVSFGLNVDLVAIRISPTELNLLGWWWSEERGERELEVREPRARFGEPKSPTVFVMVERVGRLHTNSSWHLPW
jgi:hypothetical protein